MYTTFIRLYMYKCGINKNMIYKCDMYMYEYYLAIKTNEVDLNYNIG